MLEGENEAIQNNMRVDVYSRTRILIRHEKLLKSTTGRRNLIGLRFSTLNLFENKTENQTNALEASLHILLQFFSLQYYLTFGIRLTQSVNKYIYFSFLSFGFSFFSRARILFSFIVVIYRGCDI